MAKITINGTTFEVSGQANISVSGDQISIGGKIVSSGLSGIVTVKWEGPLAHLDVDGSAEISGDVQGSVEAGGSVKCNNVGGDVEAGGSVQCGNVGGDVDAGGSVQMRK